MDVAVGVEDVEGEVGPGDLFLLVCILLGLVYVDKELGSRLSSCKGQGKQKDIRVRCLSCLICDFAFLRSMTRLLTPSTDPRPLRRSGLTLGCWSSTSCGIGALVTDAFSLAPPVFLLFGAVDLYSLVPLEASDLESSTMAVVRWRGGAMVRKAQRHNAEIDEICSMSQEEGRNGLAGLFQGGNQVAAHWTRTEILRFVGGQTRQNDT